MANTLYSDLFPYVLPELVGCSTLLAESQLRAAVIDLCRRAKIWTHEDDPFATMAKARTYDLIAPSGSALVEIKAMFVDGEAMQPDPDEYDDMRDFGVPKTYRQLTPETVAFWPTPDGEYTITTQMTLAPSRSSTAFPAWIAEKYHDAIVCGAKARLMLMPGNVFTNSQQAVYYRSMFETEIAAALADSTKAFTRTTLRTTSQH